MLARFAGAALLSSVYVVAVYLATLAITALAGEWSPDHAVGPALALALGVAILAETSGLTGVVLQLGPFGGSEAAGPQLIAWAAVYLIGVLALAAVVFSRRDL